MAAESVKTIAVVVASLSNKGPPAEMLAMHEAVLAELKTTGY